MLLDRLNIFGEIYFNMDSLNSLKIEELVDILSTQTSLYLQMHEEGANEKDFKRCKALIKAVQEEIKSRSKIKTEQSR